MFGSWKFDADRCLLCVCRCVLFVWLFDVSCSVLCCMRCMLVVGCLTLGVGRRVFDV